MRGNQHWKTGLLLGLLSTRMLAQQATPVDFTIVVYDSAQVGIKKLDRTENLVAAILLTAGISLRWIAGPLQDPQTLETDFTAYSRQECDSRPVPPVLRVRVLARAPAGTPPQALGFSLPCAPEGVQVTVYVDRAEMVTAAGGPTFGRVLAYAIAHELGHVLLHSTDHDATGLMKSIWSKADWQRAAVSIIPFSPANLRLVALYRVRHQN